MSGVGEGGGGGGAAWLHPTAIVEDGVEVGEGTRVWDHAHLRRGARVGKGCILGEKCYLAGGVTVGDFVKINAGVYLCAGVTVEDFCMIAAHAVFTNDRFPRAGNLALTGLATSEPTDDTLPTRVRRGATVGANATIGAGLTLGEFSMVGMGSVLTRDVPPHGLVVGNPARLVCWVCACGVPLGEYEATLTPPRPVTCERCARHYLVGAVGVRLEPGSGPA